MAPRDDVKIIFPVDVPTLREAYSLMEEVHTAITMPKFGLQIINSLTLPVALNVATDFDKGAFVDVKLIDIPNTVYGASKAITKQALNGMRYFNVSVDLSVNPRVVKPGKKLLTQFMRI